MAEAERLSESQRPPAPASSASARDEEPSRDSDEGERDDDDRLSVEEAERFATAFRASWEPPAPQSNGNGHRAHSHHPSAATAAGPQRTPLAESAPLPARVLVSELPGARRGKTMALGAAALAGFIVIALLGWLASNSGVPDHPNVDNPLAATPTPIADKPESKPTDAPPTPAPSLPPAQAPVATPTVAAAEPAAEPAAAAPEAVPAIATPEPTPASAPEAAPAAPAPAPALVALQITTRPQGAQLILDGAPVANPYDAMLPQGGRHVVEATAPGYRAQNLTIELTRKRSVALELEKAPAEKKESAAKTAPAKPKRPRTARPAKAASSKKGAAFASESPY